MRSFLKQLKMVRWNQLIKISFETIIKLWSSAKQLLGHLSMILHRTNLCICSFSKIVFLHLHYAISYSIMWIMLLEEQSFLSPVPLSKQDIWLGGSRWWHCGLASNNCTQHRMTKSAQTKKKNKVNFNHAKRRKQSYRSHYSCYITNHYSINFNNICTLAELNLPQSSAEVLKYKDKLSEPNKAAAKLKE